MAKSRIVFICIFILLTLVKVLLHDSLVIVYSRYCSIKKTNELSLLVSNALSGEKDRSTLYLYP